ncbi:uncharacterized protein PV07_09875 [Cladophialophora immunda]|uniref:Uncharacterized protein n=1 Tax=Cladophialophora immunda TaxID=569365 RepID=A0A0D2BYE9_9EURO|nr:uncharacterized protein PV07_09875 [Cladophialophora immunda]KIW24143.1 hypothetical protein PV07_09875 [Cladophialophora immunda]
MIFLHAQSRHAASPKRPVWWKRFRVQPRISWGPDLGPPIRANTVQPLESSHELPGLPVAAYMPSSDNARTNLLGAQLRVRATCTEADPGLWSWALAPPPKVVRVRGQGPLAPAVEMAIEVGSIMSHPDHLIKGISNPAAAALQISSFLSWSPSLPSHSTGRCPQALSC